MHRYLAVCQFDRSTANQSGEEWTRSAFTKKTGGNKDGCFIRGTVMAVLGNPTTVGQKRKGKYSPLLVMMGSLIVSAKIVLRLPLRVSALSLISVYVVRLV